MKKNMKPADCPDIKTAYKMHGLTKGMWSIDVLPSRVNITLKDRLEIAVPMGVFRAFAEWYFEDQEIEINND